MKRQLASMLAMGAALALVAGCAEGDNAADDAAGGDTDVTADAATGEAEPVEAGGVTMSPDLTIAENVGAASDLSRLNEVATAAGLGETLAGVGPYTLFAPTNAAFDDLPEGALDTLLEQGGSPLANLVSYHLVPGVVTAEDLRNAIEDGGGSAELATLTGVTLTASEADGTLVIADGAGGEARVTTADAIQANGIVHVIDGVLEPAGGEEPQPEG